METLDMVEVTVPPLEIRNIMELILRVNMAIQYTLCMTDLFTLLSIRKMAGYNTRIQSGQTILISYFHLQKDNLEQGTSRVCSSWRYYWLPLIQFKECYC